MAGWSASASAAASVVAFGEHMAGELQSLEVAPQPLVADLVDLSDLDDSPSSAAPETVAPLLYLAPRVASIFADVFGDSDPADTVGAEAADANSTEAEQDLADEDAASTSPVAGNVNSSNVNSSDGSEPVSPMYENAAILPRFHRQMYRTDI
jgi:hypothetical protein